MSEDELTRKLAELRTLLEERIRELETELELLKLCHRLVTEALSRRSFKTGLEVLREREAAATRPSEVTEEVTEEIEKVVEKPKAVRDVVGRKVGKVFAKAYIYENYVKIVPESEYEFRVDTPPFQAFFINKLLEDFRREDEENVKKGKLSPDKVLRYEVKTDEEGRIQEIVIHNYNDEFRLREIIRALGWTLEKMYLRMQQESSS